MPLVITLEQRQEWAQIIRDKRKAKGLTQEQLASLSPLYGLSYLQKIENAADGSEKSFHHFSELLTKQRKRKTA